MWTLCPLLFEVTDGPIPGICVVLGRAQAKAGKGQDAHTALCASLAFHENVIVAADINRVRTDQLESRPALVESRKSLGSRHVAPQTLITASMT